MKNNAVDVTTVVKKDTCPVNAQRREAEVEVAVEAEVEAAVEVEVEAEVEVEESVKVEYT